MSKSSEVTPVWTAAIPGRPEIYALWTLVTFDPAEEPVLYVAPLGSPDPVAGEPLPKSWVRASAGARALPDTPVLFVDPDEHVDTVVSTWNPGRGLPDDTDE